MARVISAAEGDRVENIEKALIQARAFSKEYLVQGSGAHRAVMRRAEGRVVVLVERVFFKR